MFAEGTPQARRPEDLKICVVEETPTTLYLVLPPKPAGPEATQLSDEDLEAVAAIAAHTHGAAAAPSRGHGGGAPDRPGLGRPR